MEPHPRGWSVTRAGNIRPSRVAPTKDRAIHIAKAYAREERSELVVVDEDTRIPYRLGGSVPPPSLAAQTQPAGLPAQPGASLGQPVAYQGTTETTGEE